MRNLLQKRDFTWVLHEKVQRGFNLIAVILQIKKKHLAWEASSKHPQFLENSYMWLLVGFTEENRLWSFMSLRQSSTKIVSNPEIPGLSETAAQVQSHSVDCLCIKNPWTIPVTENFGGLIWIETKLSFEYQNLMI